MRKVLICLAGAAALALAGGGCGQKGPLYLPPKNGTVVTRPASGAEAPPQETAPAAPGEKPNPDKSDETSTTSQTPKRF